MWVLRAPTAHVCTPAQARPYSATPPVPVSWRKATKAARTCTSLRVRISSSRSDSSLGSTVTPPLAPAHARERWGGGEEVQNVMDWGACVRTGELARPPQAPRAPVTQPFAQRWVREAIRRLALPLLTAKGDVHDGSLPGHEGGQAAAGHARQRGEDGGEGRAAARACTPTQQSNRHNRGPFRAGSTRPGGRCLLVGGGGPGGRQRLRWVLAGRHRQPTCARRQCPPGGGSASRPCRGRGCCRAARSRGGQSKGWL